MLNWILIDNIILNALNEDINYGDVTTENIILKKDKREAYFLAKQDGIIAGLDVAERVFKIVDKNIEFCKSVNDGAKLKKGDVFATIKGDIKSLLLAERVALNLLQRMSGIATMTNLFVQAVAGTGAYIVDTRKTVPGLRILDKYAVKIGGGRNHRINLSDAVMIKDNHIEAAGGIREAVESVRSNIGHTLKIEVETENLEQVKEALECNADIIMLDNMNVEQCEEAIKFINKRAVVEASGNVDFDKARELGRIGVDVISVGALTHSVKAMDISMKIK